MKPRTLCPMTTLKGASPGARSKSHLACGTVVMMMLMHCKIKCRDAICHLNGISLVQQKSNAD